MFGEMVGIWIADLWLRAGKPAFRYVELGPGRGTLALDALRAMARFGAAPQGVHLVETRSEEHTSELQSLMRISYAVFCLKKKNTKNRQKDINTILIIHSTANTLQQS